MSEFLKMDIFFVLTSVAVVVVTVGLVVLFRIAFRILRNIERVSDIILNEGVKLSEDMERLRQGVLREELNIERFIASIFRFVGIRKKKKSLREDVDSN